MNARLDDYDQMGIQTLHLRNLTLNLPTSQIVEAVKPNRDRISSLSSLLHARIMTLMVQLPVVGNDTDYTRGIISLELEQQVEKAVEFFMQCGADGIFLD